MSSGKLVKSRSNGDLSVENVAVQSVKAVARIATPAFQLGPACREGQLYGHHATRLRRPAGFGEGLLRLAARGRF